MARRHLAVVLGAFAVATTAAIAGSPGGTYAGLTDFDVVNGQIAAGEWTPDPDVSVPAECAHLTFAPTDIIVLTEGPDTYVAGNGSQLIFGLGGDDVINGGNQDDCIVGGPGNDWLGGDHSLHENGKDVILGGEGDDTIDGGNGKDKLFGGPGDDTLFGSNGPDRMDGGDGHDDCQGGNGPPEVVNCEVGPAPLAPLAPASEPAGDLLDGGAVADGPPLLEEPACVERPTDDPEAVPPAGQVFCEEPPAAVEPPADETSVGEPPADVVEEPTTEPSTEGAPEVPDAGAGE